MTDSAVHILKKIIENHLRFLDNPFPPNSPELQIIINQLIHGKPHHRSIKLYQYLLECFLLAGGGDQSNLTYFSKQKLKPTFNRVRRALLTAHCPKLGSFEAFAGCGYQKGKKTCGEPGLLPTCPLPLLNMKKGALNRMAFSLHLFLREVCKNDFHAFVRNHFGDGQLPDMEIKPRLEAFIKEVTRVANVGPKLAFMAFSGLFLTKSEGWDYRRVGVQMIAVDSLVHNFLHRTGILALKGKNHKYGPVCHSGRGCLGVVEDLALKIDCRQFNRSYPAYFPRFIQSRLWWYCAKDGENVCNLNKCREGKPNLDCDLYRAKLCQLFPPQKKGPI
jgi:hypothetical protein